MEDDQGGSPVKDKDKRIINARIQDICSDLTRRVVDGRPGIAEDDLDWIRESKIKYKRVLGAYEDSEEVKDGEISRQEAFINYELLDALEATFLYLGDTDTFKAINGQKQGSENARLGAKANIEVLDFFMKIHKEFDLSKQDILDIFYQLFETDGLAKEFISKGLRNFPSGCLAAVGAYLYLNDKKPGWEYSVPTIEQDASHSVDLVVKSEDVTHLMTIKGGVNIKETKIVNITTEEKVEKLRRDVVMSDISKEEKNRKLGAIYDLHDYAAGLNRKSKKTKAYYIEMPTMAF